MPLLLLDLWSKLTRWVRTNWGRVALAVGAACAGFLALRMFSRRWAPSGALGEVQGGVASAEEKLRKGEASATGTLISALAAADAAKGAEVEALVQQQASEELTGVELSHRMLEVGASVRK